MNESTSSSHSAWIVKWLPNRTETGQGSKREGVYTALEQFVWIYHQRHPLSGAGSMSNQLHVLWPMKITLTSFLL